MTADNHSPEPWSCDADYEKPIFDIRDADNMPVLLDYSTYPEDGQYLSGPDARRIVACVNFCRNLPTDFLEGKTVQLAGELGQIASASQPAPKPVYVLAATEENGGDNLSLGDEI